MRTTAAALLASVLLLAGCTGDSDEGGGGGSSSTDDEAASWQDTEACEILAEDEVTDLLGQDPPPSPRRATGWTAPPASGRTRRA